MPSGSRRMSRSSRLSINSILINASGNDPLCQQRICHKTTPSFPTTTTTTSPTVEVDQPAPPKHFPFPNTPSDSDLFFEFIMYMYVVISTGCQYLHLYRSVWWLPNSYNSQAMNFYLIDEYLVVFILIVLSRRLIYSVGCKLIEITVSPSVTGIEYDYSYFRVILLGLICSMLSVCTFFVMQNHPKVSILFLCYPFVVYLLIFGCTNRPLFETVKWCSNSKPPLHACSSNPFEIRQEAETLKANCNHRMKQILFNAVVNTYYAGFIPCCFAQPQLHFDTWWASLHLLFIFMGSFVYAKTHIMPLRYRDILHRSALHLGYWVKTGKPRSLVLTSQQWREDQLYPKGAIVKYDNKLFKAVGECTANRPGDKGLSKFYTSFVFPNNLLCLCLLLHLFVIIFQLYLLVTTVPWYKIITLSFMMFFNYYALWKITRDYVVSYKVYKDEDDVPQ